MKNKLLSCMCLAAVLGLGACGVAKIGTESVTESIPVRGSVIVPEDIKDRELKENETLYVYLNDFSYTNCFVTAQYQTISGFYAIIDSSLLGGKDQKANAMIYYTITTSYVSLEMKDKTTSERQAKYTFTSPHLSYCLIAKE